MWASAITLLNFGFSVWNAASIRPVSRRSAQSLERILGNVEESYFFASA
jgi:hypothetical protein